MTSRTSLGMGSQQRPPPRAFSESSLPISAAAAAAAGYRPSMQQRSLAQQYLPTSPIRKETFVDLTTDPGSGSGVSAAGGDGSGGGGMLPPGLARRQPSKLRIEMPSDPATLQQLSLESPHLTLTPSRAISSPGVLSVTGAQESPDNPPMPLPTRRPLRPAGLAEFSITLHAPQAAAAASASIPPAPKRESRIGDNRPKPWVFEVPSTAPRYVATSKPAASVSSSTTHRNPNTIYADFAPWHGNHLEDEFNETVVKNGFYNKSAVGQGESESARNSLASSLKQKTSLSQLSHLLASAMTRRRRGGMITAASTFKPPPRVTLTDKKRETWLLELANPATPLKKLHRTIPHGVTGKTLLDQCLSKNVPIDRAIWLHRCVGANELRNRRKNAGPVISNETAYIRDATVCVEQFVEQLASAYGDSNWKANITYAVRLATNLYAEQLLDRDHYLDWVVSGLESSSVPKLPMWLLLANIMWADILRLKRFGPRLVQALAQHVVTIHNAPDKDILLQLSSRLVSLLASLVRSNPESFISPSAWPKLKDTLWAALAAEDESVHAALRVIGLRNTRLETSSRLSRPAGRQELTSLLDTCLQSPINEHFAARCWSVSEDRSDLLATVLDWCTSIHRPGYVRLYVADHLLRAWRSYMGHFDLTSALLEYMDRLADQDAARNQMIYKLVSGLIRTGLFSVAVYMSWLITRGGISAQAEIAPDGPCATRLLVELPLASLSESQKANRIGVLQRASYDGQVEQEDMHVALGFVELAIGPPGSVRNDLRLPKKQISLKLLSKKIRLSSRALQTHISTRVYTLVLALSCHNLGLSVDSFHVARTILESAVDYDALAHVTMVVTATANAGLLASCIDTVSLHVEIFVALGRALELFEQVRDRFMAVFQEEQGPVARPALAALYALSQRIPGLAHVATQLKKDLATFDNTALDACSPVSESMALADGEGDTYDEMEKRLAGGMSLDRSTMDRWFELLVRRFDRSWKGSGEDRRPCAQLLARLRLFDAENFDHRMSEWILTTRKLSTRPHIGEAFPLLMSQGCLGVPTVLNSAGTAMPAASIEAARGSRATMYCQEVLEMLSMPLIPASGLLPGEYCRFYLDQKSACNEHYPGLTRLIKTALSEYSTVVHDVERTSLPLDRGDCQDSLLDLLRFLAIKDAGSLVRVLGDGPQPQTPAFASVLAGFTTRLLAPTDPQHSSTIPLEKLLGQANELTLPFCQIKLHLDLVAARTQDGSKGDDRMQSQLDLLSKAMDSTTASRNTTWTDLLPYMGDETIQHVRSRIQARFFELLPSFRQPLQKDPRNERNMRLAESLASVLEAIVAGQTSTKAPPLTSAIVDRIAETWEMLARRDEGTKLLRREIVLQWLPLILRFTAIHAGPFKPPVGAANNHAALRPTASTMQSEVRTRALLALSALHQQLEAFCGTKEGLYAGPLMEYVFDIALVLADGIPEDMRTACARALLVRDPGPMSVTAVPSTATTSDHRLCYLFSYRPSTTDHLAHGSRPRNPSPLKDPRRAAERSASTATSKATAGYGTTATTTAPSHSNLAIPAVNELRPYSLQRWEVLPTPNVGENDTKLSLTLFAATKI